MVLVSINSYQYPSLVFLQPSKPDNMDAVKYLHSLQSPPVRITLFLQLQLSATSLLAHSHLYLFCIIESQLT